MNIILIGTGRMGRLLKECALDAGDAVVGEYGRANIAELAAAPAADVAIDFSGPEALPAVAAYVARTGTPLVSGTTGYTAGEKAAVAALGEHAPVVWSANYSLGVAVLARALRLVTAALRPDFDIEVTETHHNRKKDAPSGTAITLAEGIVENLDAKRGWVNYAPGIAHAANRVERSEETPADCVEIRSVREGAVPGIHTVTYESEDDVLEIRHTIKNRRTLALGAVVAAEFLCGKQGVFGMGDLLRN